MLFFKRIKKWSPVISYTVLFFTVILLTYTIPFLAGHDLIWNVDGISQHYPILMEFQRILQGKAHQSLFGWSWNLGLGADQLATFAYYVVGDPFSYLIAFFPADKVALGYQLLVILRLYFVGIAFLIWTSHFHFSRISRLIGTLIYTFSGYDFYVSLHHPFFLLPMIIFPLLCFGIDHLVIGHAWEWLGMAIAIALISNFYFAYIMALGSGYYLISRYCHLSHLKVKTISLSKLGYRLFLALTTGLLLASVLLIPTLLTVFHSSRTVFHVKFANGLWWYPLKYYLAIPNQLITSTSISDYWFIVNLCGLTFLGVIYVVKHAHCYYHLTITLALIGLGTIFPAFAAIANAGTTPSNRWLFLAILPFTWATMILVDQVANLTFTDLKWFLIGTIGLIGLVWLTQGFTLKQLPHNLLTYGILLSFLIVLLVTLVFRLKNFQIKWLLIGLVLLNIISNGQGWLSPNNSHNLNAEVLSGTPAKWVKDFYDQANRALKKDNGFYRTSLLRGYYPQRTAGNDIPMVLGTHDLDSYYSIQNGFLSQFNKSLGNSQSVANSPTGEADNRTTLSNLLGVRYIFASDDILTHPKAVPYGYHIIKQLDYFKRTVSNLSNNSGTILLKSDNALPLLYTQNKAISRSNYDQLTPLRREQSLIDGAVVIHKVKTVPVINPKPIVKTVPYQVNLYQNHIINTVTKAVLYRLDRNKLNTLANQPKFNSTELKREALITGLKLNNSILRKKLRQNSHIINQNQRINHTSLHLMSSDIQDRHLSYQLQLRDPQRYRSCELYLSIKGIKSINHTIRDRLQSLTNYSIISGKPVSKLQKINRLRTAIKYPDLGGFSIVAKTNNYRTYSHQLPMNNLSDYQKQHQMLLNLGYSSKLRRAIILNFSGVKQLKFNQVKVLAVPFNNRYTKKMQTLKKNGLKKLQVTNNKITGITRTTNRTRILTTSIPYSNGWQIQVDGHLVKRLRINVGFIGARIPAGRHIIQLTYKTPGLKLGQLLSQLGFWIMFLSSLVTIFTWWHFKRKVTS